MSSRGRIRRRASGQDSGQPLLGHPWTLARLPSCLPALAPECFLHQMPLQREAWDRLLPRRRAVGSSSRNTELEQLPGCGTVSPRRLQGNRSSWRGWRGQGGHGPGTWPTGEGSSYCWTSHRAPARAPTQGPPSMLCSFGWSIWGAVTQIFTAEVPQFPCRNLHAHLALSIRGFLTQVHPTSNQNYKKVTLLLTCTL